MTCSAGFRAPRSHGLGGELMQRLAEQAAADGALYRDPQQPATATPGAIPRSLHDFAARALQRMVGDDDAVAEALGAWLSEPKPRVWFDAAAGGGADKGVALDRRTRMLYDRRCLYVNGEVIRVSGRDAVLLRRLADRGAIDAASLARLSRGAREAVDEWFRAGWLRAPQSPREPGR
jgi:50S ribosomal protein L16 3-hydroxylase